MKCLGTNKEGEEYSCYLSSDYAKSLQVEASARYSHQLHKIIGATTNNLTRVDASPIVFYSKT